MGTAQRDPVGQAPRARPRARRRTRALLPLAACALSVAAISCVGDCWPNTSPRVDVPPGPTPLLAARYVATFVNGAALPYTISGAAGGSRVRLLADTLLFTGAGTPPAASGTYVEIRVLGTTQGTGPEVVTATTSSARAWRRGTAYALLLLDDFAGLATAGAQASMYLANERSPSAPASVIGTNASFTFEPR